MPVPLQISMTPSNIQFAGNGKVKQTSVTARYSDGTLRDVTELALFFSNSDDTASIDKNGVVTSRSKGDIYVFARFDRFTAGSEVIDRAANLSWGRQPVDQRQRGAGSRTSCVSLRCGSIVM